MSSNLRPTTTVLNGLFCLFRPSRGVGCLRRGRSKVNPKDNSSVCPPGETLTFCWMDSAALRHNLCLPSSLISIELESPSKSTLMHHLTPSLSPIWSQNPPLPQETDNRVFKSARPFFPPEKCSSPEAFNPPCSSLHWQDESLSLICPRSHFQYRLKIFLCVHQTSV